MRPTQLRRVRAACRLAGSKVVLWRRAQLRRAQAPSPVTTGARTRSPKNYLATLFLSALLLTTPASARVSDDQAGLISMTCGSIQLQLDKTRKEDSKMRVYLGSKFEFVLVNLITNLNLRLIKHNLSSPDLTASQTTFSSEREFFKSAFTDYSRALDTLIAADCKNNPYDFHDKLEIVREKRETVRASYLRLKDVLILHRTTVINFKDTL